MPDKIRNINIDKVKIYAVFIIMSCVFTIALNIVHTLFFLKINISLASFVIPIIAGICFGYLLSNIKILSKQLLHIAYTDPLTQIYNRLPFHNLLEAEIDKINRYGGICSIIFFDIDHFKVINDKYGHLTGDEALKKLSEIVNTLNRNSDVFARYGGEEFIILASSTNLEGATIHAERLREEIEKTAFINAGTITCSFGVVEFVKGSDDFTSIIKRADSALYDAKRKGRNCVVQA